MPAVPLSTRAHVAAVSSLYAGLVALQFVVPALHLEGPADAAGPASGHAASHPTSRSAAGSSSGPASQAAGRRPAASTDRNATSGHDGRVDAARRAGCTMADVAQRATRDAGIPFYVGCAFLVQETGGGRNVFGHDPTVFAGAGKVTRSKYLAYKHVRERTGQMQGVGPMQLTWWSYQDRADRLGGAWRPYPNMLVGFRHLAALHHATGSWTAAAHDYNGGGAAAASYAAQMSRRFDRMRHALG